jgi:hypothetical protein
VGALVPSTWPKCFAICAADRCLLAFSSHLKPKPSDGDLESFPYVKFSRNSHACAIWLSQSAAVLTDVDDINNNFGFWQPQADFRIVERIDGPPSTFTSFPDTELEAIYEELVREFVTYQTNVSLRAISRFSNVDLAMIYIEQPDGSEHQFLAIDPRQATNPTDPNSIGQNQDPSLTKPLFLRPS